MGYCFDHAPVNIYIYILFKFFFFHETRNFQSLLQRRALQVEYLDTDDDVPPAFRHNQQDCAFFFVRYAFNGTGLRPLQATSLGTPDTPTSARRHAPRRRTPPPGGSTGPADVGRTTPRRCVDTPTSKARKQLGEMK